MHVSTKICRPCGQGTSEEGAKRAKYWSLRDTNFMYGWDLRGQTRAAAFKDPQRGELRHSMLRLVPIPDGDSIRAQDVRLRLNYHRHESSPC